MNDGKICVSVCAKNTVEFIEKTKRATEFADVIELRFDCLDKIEPKDLWSKIKTIRVNYNGVILATYRPQKQGGNKNLEISERKEFWRNSAVYEFVDWVDFEYDLLKDEWHTYFRATLERFIWSFHHFKEVPHYLDSIYEKLASATNYTHGNKKQDIVKIAVQTNEITDSLLVWKLLEKAHLENIQLIPIAMGEAGKWTRILGLAFGSPITYASLESGNETAPGQISAKDLIDVYRVKELNKETEIYGIIGDPVKHSLSPYMHNSAFKYHHLNAVYIPFEVSNLDKFIIRMVQRETRELDWNLKGFSVTIPHKEAIIKHLDFIDESAKIIGAVNTVKIIDGKLYGYNTDAFGFIEPLKNSFGDLKDANVGIIGNGGAARACIYGLKKQFANVTVFARNLQKAKHISEEFNVKLLEIPKRGKTFENIDILVNTTPLGTIGSLVNETPATAEQLKNLHMAYDLVYNPFETLFLKEAKSVDIPTIGGLAMLVAQGLKQFEIWTELKVPMKIMSRAALQRL